MEGGAEKEVSREKTKNREASEGQWRWRKTRGKATIRGRKSKMVR